MHAAKARIEVEAGREQQRQIHIWVERVSHRCSKRDASVPSGRHHYIDKLRDLIVHMSEWIQRTSSYEQAVSSLVGQAIEWREKKIKLFADFFVACYQLMIRQQAFDWKEIGAVHATTGLAVFTHDFTTTAESLWLVENRAVVTRLAATGRFLEDTNGLVIGLDGLGEGHRLLVYTLLEGASSIKQVLVWVDYDETGYYMSRGIAELLSRFPHFQVKWVLPAYVERECVVRSFTEYETLVFRYREQYENREQEEWLRGEHEWMRWLSQ